MRRVGATRELPRALEEGRARFERWRRTRTQRRIPEELWSEAVELGRAHGVHRTARTLRLNVQTLRERTEPEKARKAAWPSAFVELPSVAVTSQPDCVVVLESADGASMRIEVRRGDAVDIGALALGFLGRQ